MAGKVGCGGGCRGGGWGGRGEREGYLPSASFMLGRPVSILWEGGYSRRERERVGVGTSRSRLHARSEKSGKFR